MYGDLDNLTPFDNRKLLPMEPQLYKTTPQQYWRGLPGGNVDQSSPLLKENDGTNEVQVSHLVTTNVGYY